VHQIQIYVGDHRIAGLGQSGSSEKLDHQLQAAQGKQAKPNQ